MSKTERLLRLCADSMKMSGWNDALEMITDSVTDKCTSKMLTDDELAMVAGGVKAELHDDVKP